MVLGENIEGLEPIKNVLDNFAEEFDFMVKSKMKTSLYEREREQIEEVEKKFEECGLSKSSGGTTSRKADDDKKQKIEI